MAKSPEVPRRLEAAFSKAIQRHAQQTGQILWAWNFVHAQLLHVFRELVAPDNHALALALWHSNPSDKGQRDMLLQVAEVVLAPSSRELRDLSWVLKRVQELSPFRNDGAHTLIAMSGSGAFRSSGIPILQVEPDVKSAKPASVKRLAQQPIEAMWLDLRGDLWVLGRYACSLAGRVSKSRPDAYGFKFRRPRLKTQTAAKRSGGRKKAPLKQ